MIFEHCFRLYSLKHCAKISPPHWLFALIWNTVVSYQSWNTLRRHIHTIYIYQKVIQVFQIGANNHCGWVIFEHCFRLFGLKHCANISPAHWLFALIWNTVVSYQSWNTLRRHVHTLFIYKMVVSYQSWNTLRRRIHTLFIYKKVVSYQSWNTLRRHIHTLFIYKKVVSYQSWNTLRRHIHTLFIYKKVVSYQSWNTLRRHIHTLFIYKKVVSYQSWNTLRRHTHHFYLSVIQCFK